MWPGPLIFFVLLLLDFASAASTDHAYLCMGLYYGLTNQRLSLLRSVLTAKKHGMVLVLPSWQIDYTQHGRADFMPFEYFYSAEHFSTFLRQQHNVTTATQLPSELTPACIAQLQNLYALGANKCPPNFNDAIQSWAQKHRVVCLTAPCAFYHALPRNHGALLDALRPALQPSKLFAAAADGLQAALMRRYNTSSFVTVHIRTEQDFHEACTKIWKHEDYTCFVSDADVAAYLRTRVEPGQLLYIPSGNSLASMPALCGADAPYRCWQRNTLGGKGPLDPRIVPKLTSLAFLDFVVATRGDAFFGNRFSTFSVELASEFKRRGLTAEFYNERLQRPQAAAASQVAAGKGAKPRPSSKPQKLPEDP